MKSHFVILLCCFVSEHIFADAARQEAERLMELSGTRNAIHQMMTMTLEQEIHQNPQLAPFREVMLKFFTKHLSYDSMKDEFISLYTESFTPQELADINDFYETPVGRKSVEVLPMLMQRGGEIGARRVQENLPELRLMLKDEIKRMQRKQSEVVGEGK